MRTARQRARRAVLLGLAVLVLVQVLLLAAQERWPALRDPDHDRKMKLLKARLAPQEGQPRPLSVVQIGSSRTFFGVRGRVAEPWLEERLGRPVVVFNLGICGAGVLLNRLEVERLFNRGLRPDLVLLEVLPVVLAEGYSLEDVLPERLPASRLGYGEMRLLKRLLPQRRDLEREWWLAQAAPLFAHRFVVMTATAPNCLRLVLRTDKVAGADESGWLPLILPRSARSRALAKTDNDYREPLRHFRLSSRRVAVLRETVERCQEAGSSVALVLMPEGPFMRSLYPADAWRAVRKMLAELQRQTGASLIDLREAEPEEEFLDSHHLFPEGAAQFSRRLAACVEPLLRRLAGH